MLETILLIMLSWVLLGVLSGIIFVILERCEVTLHNLISSSLLGYLMFIVMVASLISLVENKLKNITIIDFRKGE